MVRDVDGSDEVNDRQSRTTGEGHGRALVVDDQAEGRQVLGDRLSRAGFVVSYAADGLEALDVFVRECPDLVVTDDQMPRVGGIELVRRIRLISDVPVVMVTDCGSVRDCERAMRVGADRFLQIWIDLDRVGEVARDLVRDRMEPARRGAPDPVSITRSDARALVREERRSELARLLVTCRGNIAEMARRMGKDRSTVRYHLDRLGMLDRRADAAPKGIGRDGIANELCHEAPKRKKPTP